VVLVGGEGTRLRPLTFTTPKPVLPIAEVPLIERVIRHLATAGVSEVVLSLRYRPEAFMDAFPNSVCAGVALVYAVEPEPLDTAGAIRFAAGHAGITEGTLLVANGDVLTDLDLMDLLDFHRRSGAEATISLTPVEDPSRFGVVPTDGEGRVTAFIEKPARDEAPTNLINAGIYVIEASVLAGIPTGRRVSIERETFPKLVAEGALYAMASDAYWLDTGTPAQYLQANADLLAGRRDQVPAPGANLVAPGRWQLGRAGSVVGDVGGGSLLGEDASVESGAEVSASVVGRGATVGAEAVVTGSVLLPGARVNDGARIEGSIVGEHAVVGAGSIVRGLSVVGGRAEVPAGEVLDGARFPDLSAGD
jgi:mannose-1-phosphate guanylyltransferase